LNFRLIFIFADIIGVEALRINQSDHGKMAFMPHTVPILFSNSILQEVTEHGSVESL
jgi:hypothetical protein